MYALALPFSRGHEGVALFAFLGGLSAATGMVVVSTLTLSLMIGNHWFAPGLLRGAWSHGGDDGDRRGDVLLLRRVGIAATMLLAWAYSRQIAGSDARSEEHTSALQSLMRTSYAIFCLKKNKTSKEPVSQSDQKQQNSSSNK